MSYSANSNRYQLMEYRRCGNSGLKLPAISLGLWHNFGEPDPLENCRDMLRTAFDNGITHFDIANNYGPPPGAAETTFGKIYSADFKSHRDELIISTKAGWKMWDGPYGDFGSRKYLIASLDQSLKRTGLEYVDIFYHHRPDPETRLEETMMALDQVVRQGKALYAGISGYKPAEAESAFSILKQLGTPCLIHQPKYSMLNRWVENGLLDVLEKENVGCISFSTLAQGLLTDKYIKGIPADSRAGRQLDNGAISKDIITPELVNIVQQLHDLAAQRNQTLAQMAIAWILKDKRITSVILGASKPAQITDSLKAIDNYQFSKEELDRIDSILSRAPRLQ